MLFSKNLCKKSHFFTYLIDKLTFVMYNYHIQKYSEGGEFLQNMRREAIRKMLASKPFISIKELTKMFPDVSEMTIRRDIEYFESTNEAIKVRGGARSMKFISVPAEDSITKRIKENVEQKKIIAGLASRFLETGRSIFIDSGSTTRHLAEFVPYERFSFTTTDPFIALELSKPGLSIVNMVGGRIEGENQTVTGLQATRFLSDVNVDIAFLSPSGLSERSGFTVGNFNECELKKIVVQKARTVIMLMDSTKFDRSLPYTFCTMKEVSVIVTDTEPPRSIAESAASHGVRIITSSD